MLPFLEGQFGNPHSNDHIFGWEAAGGVAVARGQVAALINADDDEIVFTSGATESCNLAIRGICHGNASSHRNRILTLATEHPAVLETALDLQRYGFEVVILPVSQDGTLDLDLLKNELDKRTLLVSVMAANNEIGVLQPIRNIAALCHSVGAVFHSDATQAVGRMPIDVEHWGVDLMSFSAHKIYGPKGMGALFLRAGLNIRPIITGGSQEAGHRGGTLAPALAVGFGAACELAMTQEEGDVARIRRLTYSLLDQLHALNPDIRLFGCPRHRLVGNLSLGIPGVPGTELVRALADRIAISSGAACSSATSEPSRVLVALGLDVETADTAFRISLGRFTTKEDVEAAVTAFANCPYVRY